MNRSVPLGAKLLAVLLAATVSLAAFALVWLGPQSRDSFVARADALIDHSADALRELARDSASSSRTVLVDLIRQTADSRRRALLDLPMSLYGGDADRIRSAVLRRDRERAERLATNVDVIGDEMQRRSSDRIAAQIDALHAEQAALGEAFGGELQRQFLLATGIALAALLVLLGFGTHRLVVRPVAALRVATRSVAAGDLSVPVPTGRRDELGQLSSDFASMVAELRATKHDLDAKNAELRAWNDRLESEVAAKTGHLESALADLRRAQSELVQAAKMASVGTLAGGVAHEFNNLVGGILGCAREALADETDERRREPLDVIVRAATRANSITDQLLRFARHGVGDRTMVDVSTLLAEVEQLVEPQSRRLGVTTDVRVDAGLDVHADAGALHQVLLNLWTNALQAMPDGGTLRVDGREDPARGDVVLTVCDTGVGVPEEHRDRVFEPFFTTKDVGGDGFQRGSGLGLAVSYRIVEAHGGRIEIVSSGEAGTTFAVRLPRRPTDEADEVSRHE